MTGINSVGGLVGSGSGSMRNISTENLIINVPNATYVGGLGKKREYTNSFN
jgi:hypothetical protein